MNYRTEEKDGLITIWDDAKGIGLQFKQGEPLQLYTCSILIAVQKNLDTPNRFEEVQRIADKLIAYATENYPNEFEEIKT